MSSPYKTGPLLYTPPVPGYYRVTCSMTRRHDLGLGVQRNERRRWYNRLWEPEYELVPQYRYEHVPLVDEIVKAADVQGRVNVAAERIKSIYR
jgi:hypothetical protein